MKIALVDAFPNLQYSAEAEFIERCLRFLERSGHTARKVETSADIIAFDPDVVFATHEDVAKLTDHFTVGFFWSPPVFYMDDEDRKKNVLTWDLIVPSEEITRRFATDLLFPNRHREGVSRNFIWPSALATGESPSLPEHLSLAYFGVHWDGARHEQFFRRLAEEVDLSIYGPPGAWDYLPQAYKGVVPFDGVSLGRALKAHGAVLAIHKEQHRLAGTPSMRVFEGCAAGCLTITDPMPALVDMFGDALDYVDMGADIEAGVARIKDILAAARRDVAGTRDRVARATRIFDDRCAIDVLLPRILAEVEEKKKERLAAAPRVATAGRVSVIVRCGSRPLGVLARAVRSIAAQSYEDIEIVFVRFRAIAGFEDYLSELRSQGRFRDIRVLEAPANSIRSTSLWLGLRHVHSPFLAILDDDDEWFGDHLRDLISVFIACPETDVAHAGGIRNDEEGLAPGLPTRLLRADGSWTPESRKLAVMRDHDIRRLFEWNNAVLSHSFVARSSLLTEDVLEDPGLAAGEDVYLYLLWSALGAKFRFNGRASAIWNWRVKTSDNSASTIAPTDAAAMGRRINLRLSHHRFPAAFLGGTVIGSGVSSPARAVQPPESSAVDFGTPLTMAFSALRFPSCLAEVTGLSWAEEWGRWSDGAEVVMRFTHPLPSRIGIELVAAPVASMLYRKTILSLGRSRKALTLTAPDKRLYTLILDNPNASDTLKFLIPKTHCPADVDGQTDTRELGVQFMRMTIVEDIPPSTRSLTWIRRPLRRVRELLSR